MFVIVCMKKTFIILSLIAILVSIKSGAQVSGSNESTDFEVETFLSILDEFLPERLVDNLEEQLPKGVKIVNYGMGDISNDSLPDLVIAYKTNTLPKNTYKVMVFIDENLNTFTKAGEFNAQWRDTPEDVAFTFKNQRLYVSSRKSEKWCFEIYSYTNNKLTLQATEIY